MTNVEKTALDLEKAGLKKGDSVVMHIAFSKLGGGITPDEFTEGLMTALGEEGTLIIPSLSWENVSRSHPIFDANTTPVCIGFFPEYFRNRKDTVRSVHPTHSCSALGKYAKEFTRDHYRDRTPVGENSPFIKNIENGGKILFVGCGTRPNTTMHGVEEYVKPSYLFGDDIEYTLTDADGKTFTAVYNTHGFKGVSQRYDRMENLLGETEITYGKVLGADSVLMDAAAVRREGIKALRTDGRYFVESR